MRKRYLKSISMNKKTVVLGASPNPSRYAYIASELLSEYGHEVVPVGIRKGEVSGKEIMDGGRFPVIKDVDTVTLYVAAARQPSLFDYILSLNPKRVIFNPGTENPILYKILDNAGIPWMEACTLVMLRTGQY